MYVRIIKGTTTGGWPHMGDRSSCGFTQSYAGRALGSNLHSKFKIGFTSHLGGWKGTKMYPIDMQLKAAMSEGAIGIHLNICSALRSIVCESLET